MMDFVKSILIAVLLSSINCSIAGFKGIPGLSPDPLGFDDNAAALSANGSLLILSHTNGSIIFFSSNGTDFTFQQIITIPRYADRITISSDQQWVFFPINNVLVGYQYQNGLYVQRITYSCPWTSDTPSADTRFKYVESLRLIYIYREKFTTVIILGVSPTGFTQLQTITIPLLSLEGIDAPQDGSFLILFSDFRMLTYVLDPLHGNYSYSNVFIAVFRIFAVQISSDSQYIAACGFSYLLHIFVRVSAANYLLKQTIITSNFFSGNVVISEDNKMIMVIGSNFGVLEYIYNSITGLFQPKVTNYPWTTFTLGYAYSNDIIIMCFPSPVGTFAFFQCKVEGCITCQFAKLCQICQNGRTLVNGKCLLPEQAVCVDGLMDHGICVSYCEKKCAACVGSADNCFGCSLGQTKSLSGECIPTSSATNYLSIAFAIVSDLRISRTKFLFLLLDDYQLYQYHKTDYRGIIKQILEFTKQIQDKKTSILDEDSVGFMVRLHKAIPDHSEDANKKYLVQHRRDDGIVQNLLAYVIFEIPVAGLFYLTFWGLFCLLFRHSISRFFRIFSFLLFFWDMIYCDNVQYFAFLSFESFSSMHFDHPSQRFSSVFSLLFSFSVLIYSLCFCQFCRLSYGWLAKYFLDNLYRIKGCYLAMTLIYGVRPFLRGFIHTLYNHQQLQLSLLCSVDFLIVITMFALELFGQLYITKTIFAMQAVYLLATAHQNILLIFNNDADIVGQQYQKQQLAIRCAVIVKLLCTCSLLIVALVVAIIKNSTAASQINKLDATDTKVRSINLIRDQKAENKQKQYNEISFGLNNMGRPKLVQIQPQYGITQPKLVQIQPQYGITQPKLAQIQPKMPIEQPSSNKKDKNKIFLVIRKHQS